MLCYHEIVSRDFDYKSIPEMALSSAERFGDSLAIIDGAVEVTFAGVAAEMLATARGLVSLGIEPGDTVALWAPNSARWIVAALGILSCGAWVVPVNTRFKEAEAVHVIRKTRAKALFCVNGFLDTDPLDMLRRADPHPPALAKAVIMDGPVHPGDRTWDDLIEAGQGVPESAVRARIDAIGPDDVSDIIFTSGTTGHPKGVVLRHGASIRTYQLCNEGWQIGEGDRTLVIMPFFHCFGYKFGWMLALMSGATTVPMAVFEPEATLWSIERDHITHLGGSPTMFGALLDYQTAVQADLSSLRVATVSAAYVPVELIRRMRDELGLAYAMTGYGLTEAHATVAITYPDDPPETVANWSGRPLPGVEVRLIDDAGQDVPLGERGEILVRGFNLSSGYYEEPESTAEVFQADGWLHTGDIAYMNEAGYLKVCDRKKDMFIVGGFNVAPAEVEGMLTAWEKISAAAVVAIPDQHYGEVGVAFIVPTPGIDLTSEEVVAFARQAMANYKVPRRVEIVAALPLNATGKVLKHELRARLAQQQPVA
jgi:acyl-CoA synthetase (AMP-forming)/AMP-acid ligase II